MQSNWTRILIPLILIYNSVIKHLSFHDKTIEILLLSSMHRDELDTCGDTGDFQRLESRSGYDLSPSEGHLPTFEVVQPLVLK